jgi:fumarate hydratase class II
MAARSGNFQLNVMLPLIADKLLGSIELLAGACDATASAVAGFTVNHQRLEASLARNPILVTALNARIGYDAAAAIAKRAYAEQRPIIEVAAEETDIPRSELATLLDPARLTGVNKESV